jgi:hypothetical protein
MTKVRPVSAADALAARLSLEETLVFAAVDAPVAVEELVELTGLAPGQVEAIVHRLASAGVVAVDEPAPSVAPPQRPQSTPPARAVEEPAETPEEERAEAAEADAAEHDAAKDEGSYRQLYEARFHALGSDERIQAARAAHGPELLALCFDAEARVVAAVLENPSVGLDHARLIARHHRTATGLEIVSRRVEWLRDSLVERRLLRNPQSGEVVLNRVLSPKGLQAVYKICIDRDTPDLTRVRARGQLHRRYQVAPPEERSELILRTEGRCLMLLVGCTFDAKTTQILCARPSLSVLLVQNLAKFAATPPSLLAHLLKQPFVRTNAALRKMLLQHPNLPGDAKQRG